MLSCQFVGSYQLNLVVIKLAEEIDLLQEKLNVKTEKLNAMKGRRDELSRKLDETETHLKQVGSYCNFRLLFLAASDFS